MKNNMELSAWIIHIIRLDNISVVNHYYVHYYVHVPHQLLSNWVDQCIGLAIKSYTTAFQFVYARVARHNKKKTAHY